MVSVGIATEEAAFDQDYDRKSELKAFDDTKGGVKGLVDAGITQVPRIFIQPPDHISYIQSNPIKSQLSFPIIDLDGIDKDPIQRKDIVNKVRDASGTWGFFQVVNHGIPVSVLEEMIDGVHRFYEQDNEVKKQWYTRDNSGKTRVVYNSNFDLYTAPAANWRDSFYCSMAPNHPKPEELPPPCREILMEYTEQVMKLGCCLFELLSEALGLNADHLKEMGCAEGLAAICHYYPQCPQPEVTMGTTKHSDNDFMTVLLQDHIGGLQVLHQSQWIDVPPTPGALVVNIGDLLQAFQSKKSITLGENSNSKSEKRNKSLWMRPISHGFHVVECQSMADETTELHFQPDSVVSHKEQIQGTEVWMFGIFDARIGDGFPKYMQSQVLEKKPREYRVRRKMKETMRKAYLGGRGKMSEKEKKLDVGSASAVVINGKKLVIADMGNYKAIVCRNGEAYQINRKHQQTSSRSWSSKLGCGIGMGAVCSLGVNKAQKSSELVVGSERIESDTEFLILGSPGIWEVMRHQEAVSLIRHIEDPQEAAECLAKEALTRMSKTNISCLLIRFE